MSSCDVCGKHENMPYQCHHCGGTFCGTHRLPEAHDCPGLENWNDPKGVFDSGFDDSVVDRGGSGGFADRLGLNTGTGGILGYFRGNMTYVFLGLMWITFLFQYFIVPFFGIPAPTRFDPSPLWSAIFVLQSTHPFYVWTWVTSIFAHAGFWHIAVNSIVIFFFGRIVEQYLGSKRFSAFFIVSGAVAGLAQIGLVTFQGGIGGVYGASGAGLAIMAFLTVINPDLRVYLWFLIPVPIWLITIGYFVLSVGGIFGVELLLSGNIANMGHLAGLIIGLAYGTRMRGKQRAPKQLQFGGGGGPGGPGRRRF